MERKQPIGTGRPRGRYPLAFGLIASALLHLLLVILNPAFLEPSHGSAGGAPSAPGAQFTVLSLTRDDDEDVVVVDAIPPEIMTPSSVAAPRSVSGDADMAGRGAGPESPTDATVAERLRIGRALPRPAPIRESENERALREARERVRRAGDELGPLPPNGVAGSAGGGGASAGIRIPFGFKPPPPPVTVPAPPPPDSILRRDSIRAAARAAFVRDSLRIARDTTKLRNVAPRRPIVIPRVPPPDTTVRTRPLS